MVTQARDFLGKVPAYESHYSRRDCGKTFLSLHLTITSIYEVNKGTLTQGESPISYRKFNTEFHNLNLKIKPLKEDTCPKCDTLALKTKIVNEDERGQFAKQLEDHHKDAEYAYDSKKANEERSKVDKNSNIITFDMQKCLPTPLVQNSVAFHNVRFGPLI